MMPGRGNLAPIGRAAALVALTCSSVFLQGNIGRTSNLEQRLLAAHNRERDAAGIPALRWDDALATSAAEWGEHLVQINDLENYPDDPRDPDPEGENLWL